MNNKELIIEMLDLANERKLGIISAFLTGLLREEIGKYADEKAQE